MTFGYADPPYLGQGAKWYGQHHPDAARWDDPQSHVELLAELDHRFPDGWAVSLSVPALALYLAHCPATCRIGAWVKPWHHYTPRVSVQYAWEPVLWSGGRNLSGRRPWVRDWLSAGAGNPAHGPQLVGAKPPAFNRWIADLLGYQDGDALVDLYPGSSSLSRELSQGVLPLGGDDDELTPGDHHHRYLTGVCTCGHRKASHLDGPCDACPCPVWVRWPAPTGRGAP